MRVGVRNIVQVCSVDIRKACPELTFGRGCSKMIKMIICSCVVACC